MLDAKFVTHGRQNNSGIILDILASLLVGIESAITGKFLVTENILALYFVLFVCL